VRARDPRPDSPRCSVAYSAQKPYKQTNFHPISVMVFSATIFIISKSVVKLFSSVWDKQIMPLTLKQKCSGVLLVITVIHKRFDLSSSCIRTLFVLNEMSTWHKYYMKEICDSGFHCGNFHDRIWYPFTNLQL
jgi:hypothetical protein